MLPVSRRNKAFSTQQRRDPRLSGFRTLAASVFPGGSEVSLVDLCTDRLFHHFNDLFAMLILEGLANFFGYFFERFRSFGVQLINVVAGGIAEDLRDFTWFQVEHGSVIRGQT